MCGHPKLEEGPLPDLTATKRVYVHYSILHPLALIDSARALVILNAVVTKAVPFSGTVVATKTPVFSFQSQVGYSFRAHLAS